MESDSEDECNNRATLNDATANHVEKAAATSCVARGKSTVEGGTNQVGQANKDLGDNKDGSDPLMQQAGEGGAKSTEEEPGEASLCRSSEGATNGVQGEIRPGKKPHLQLERTAATCGRTRR